MTFWQIFIMWFIPTVILGYGVDKISCIAHVLGHFDAISMYTEQPEEK